MPRPITTWAMLSKTRKVRRIVRGIQKALSIKPDYTEAYLNMGNALKDQGKLEESLEAFKKLFL